MKRYNLNPDDNVFPPSLEELEEEDLFETDEDDLNIDEDDEFFDDDEIDDEEIL